MPPRIEIKPEGFAEAAAAYNGILARFLSITEKSAYAVGQRAVELIQRYYRGAGETAPDRTARRTGRLANSYDAITEQDQTSVLMRLGVIRPGTTAEVLAYAATHEFGAIISPKRAQFLAIPTREAKTAAGVARGKPRSFPNTFVRIFPGGLRGAIYQRNPGEQRARKLFYLRRDPVRIPPRPALRPVESLVVQELTRRAFEDFRTALEAR